MLIVDKSIAEDRKSGLRIIYRMSMGMGYLALLSRMLFAFKGCDLYLLLFYINFNNYCCFLRDAR